MALTRSRTKKSLGTQGQGTIASSNVSSRVEKRKKKAQDESNTLDEGLKDLKKEVPEFPRRARPTTDDQVFKESVASASTSHNVQPTRATSAASVAPRRNRKGRSSVTPWARVYTSIEEAEEYNRAKVHNRYHPDNFVPGTIVHTRHYTEDSDPGTKGSATTDGHYQLLQNGKMLDEKLYAKERFMIIVNRYDGHYVCLPCFSFNDMSLYGRNPNQRCEYVHVRVRPNPEPLKDTHPEGMYPPLGIQTLYEGIRPMRDSTVIHFTMPISIRYTRRVMLAGKLWPESQTRLQEMYSRLQCVPFWENEQATGVHQDETQQTAPQTVVPPQEPGLAPSEPGLTQSEPGQLYGSGQTLLQNSPTRNHGFNPDTSSQQQQDYPLFQDQSNQTNQQQIHGQSTDPQQRYTQPPNQAMIRPRGPQGPFPKPLPPQPYTTYQNPQQQQQPFFQQPNFPPSTSQPYLSYHDQQQPDYQTYSNQPYQPFHNHLPPSFQQNTNQPYPPYQNPPPNPFASNNPPFQRPLSMPNSGPFMRLQPRAQPGQGSGSGSGSGQPDPFLYGRPS